MKKKIKKMITKIYFFKKKILYSFFSNNNRVNGSYLSYQPVVLRGKGQIFFRENVAFGVINSPKYYDSYAYIEARTDSSIIEFGNEVKINNAFSVISEKKVLIGDKTIIGHNCSIMDSNFHNLHPDKRRETDEFPQEVIIGNNVFIGNNVTILKGVSIGENSVIGSNSVVTKSFPENVIVAGNPATIIRSLD